MFDLKADNTLFLFVDFQEKLMPAMKNVDDVIEISEKAYEFAKMTGTPYMFTTQYKKGLGGLVKEFADEDEKTLDKTEFSCYKNEVIKSAIENFKIENVVLLGQETHICVFQTARDMLQAGYKVLVMEDVTTARKKSNKKNALKTLSAMGASVVNLELVIFDILKDSKNPNFKEAQALIK